MNTEKPDATASPSTLTRLRRKPRTVRPHSSGAWTVCIGLAPTADSTRLRPKDWYFRMGKAEAEREAARIQKEWTFTVENWPKLYQPKFAAINHPFAATPHWQLKPSSSGIAPAPAEVAAYQSRPATRDEIGEAYAQITLSGIFSLFKLQQTAEVLQGEKQAITQGALEKNIRNGLKFMGKHTQLGELGFETLQAAKMTMFNSLSRRTVRNYLGDVKKMLDWFYGSDYGQWHEKFPGYEKVFEVKNAGRTDITPYSPEALKALLASAIAKDERLTLYIMLGLNCGMYESDIGRLTLAEVNLAEGYIFWDREKQPENPFKVKHELWPETLALVQRHIQPPEQKPRYFTEYRKGTPENIDCTQLAFVDADGLPLYRVRQNNTAYDKIGKAFGQFVRDTWPAEEADNDTTVKRRAAEYQFHNLRKSTNQILSEMLESMATDEQGLVAATEISDQFLGQANARLRRLYKLSGLKMYGRMNHYLKRVGDQLRASGVFPTSKPQKH